MTNREFQRLCDECFNELKNTTPIDTGNLRYNATLMEYKNGGKVCEIYVDGDGEDGIAYYMPFTNEPWISPKWNGRKNPNEGWWQNKALKAVLEHIQIRLKNAIVSIEEG